MRSFKEMEALWKSFNAVKPNNKSLIMSKFDAVNKPQGSQASHDWQDIVTWVMEGHLDWTAPKNEAWLINFVEFTNGYRNDENALRMHALVIDYDDGKTIEEAIEMYKDLEYVLFTSYSHQINKYRVDGSIKDTPKDKFRIIFPFETVCEYDEWVQINEYVLKFAPNCDNACKTIAQCYTYNFTHPDNQHRAIVKYNAGKLLDWKTWDKNPVKDSASEYVVDESYEEPTDHMKQYVLDEVKGNTEFNNDRDVWLRAAAGLKQGGYTLADFTAISLGASAKDCKNLWNSLGNRPGKKSTMGTVWHMIGGYKKYYETHPEQSKKPSVEELTTGFKKRSKKRKIDNTPIIDMDYEEAWTRKERSKKLTAAIGDFNSGTHLILAGEGYGKSFQAVKWAQQGRKILFTSLSNEQAEEQAASFMSSGLTVQLITGTEYNLNKQGIEVTRYADINPWQIGNINEDATIATIMVKRACDTDEAQEAFDLAKPRLPRFNDVDIVVTTHARLTGWGTMNNKIGDTDAPMVPRKVTIIIDDPSANQFKKLMAYDARFTDCKIDGADIEQTERGRYHYFVKPEKYTLGFGFPYHMKVFTTTELLIANLMDITYSELIVHNMLQKRVFSGNITMLKTPLVYSKFDAIIPLLVNRLERRVSSDIVYIANGQGMEHNLINTKGQNKFSERHIIIEISEAPLNVIHEWCHELDWDIDDPDHPTVNIVKYILAGDEMQQAIGRNRGYRWKDRMDSGDDKNYAMVVLASPALVENIVHVSRYHFTDVKDLHKFAPTKQPEKWSVAGGMEWLINNVGRYMDVGVSEKQRSDRPDIQSDIKAVYGNLKGVGKHIQFLERLIKCSEYMVEYDKDKPLFNLVPKKVNKIGQKVTNICRDL